jgi:hypothetical protein
METVQRGRSVCDKITLNDLKMFLKVSGNEDKEYGG